MSQRFLLKTYVDQEIYDEIVRLAAEGDRSLAAEIRRACRAHVARERIAADPRVMPIDKTIGAAVGLRKAIAVMDAEASLEKSLKETNSASARTQIRKGAHPVNPKPTASLPQPPAGPPAGAPSGVFGGGLFTTDTGVSSHQ